MQETPEALPITPAETHQRRMVDGAAVLKVLAAVALLCALWAGWRSLAGPVHKYRLSVHIQTPERTVSRASIYAVYQDVSIGAIGGGTYTRGDGVFLDLGNGKNLVVTMDIGMRASGISGGMDGLALKAFADVGTKVPFKQANKLTGTVPVRGYNIPTLISFENINDETSWRVIRPDNLEEVFGKGHHFLGMSLTMEPVGFWPFDFGGRLGNPVTHGIERHLLWLKQRGALPDYYSTRHVNHPWKLTRAVLRQR